MRRGDLNKEIGDVTVRQIIDSDSVLPKLLTWVKRALWGAGVAVCTIAVYLTVIGAQTASAVSIARETRDDYKKHIAIQQESEKENIRLLTRLIDRVDQMNTRITELETEKKSMWEHIKLMESRQGIR